MSQLSPPTRINGESDCGKHPALALGPLQTGIDFGRQLAKVDKDRARCNLRTETAELNSTNGLSMTRKASRALHMACDAKLQKVQ